MDPSFAGASLGASPAIDVRPDPRSRCRGCLIGSAAGDALGAAVEFDRLPDIRARFGEGGIRDLAPCYGRLGAVTADTQLTLFTAEGLIRAALRHARPGSADKAVAVQRAYLRWLTTQGEAPPLPVPLDGWLVQLRPLWARRAPGLTAQTALRSIEILGRPAHNDSRGNGAVTHIAPVGLLAGAPEAFELGERIAGLTHGHASARLSGGVLACVLARLLQGEPLEGAIEAAKRSLRGRPDHGEVLTAIQQAQRLAASKAPATAAAVESLGAGWVATEALAIALYCSLVTSGFEEAVVLAVNHSGDSDSTGALTGSLAGAAYGEAAIPDRWTVDLELHGPIRALADDLSALRAGTLDLRSITTQARYPAG